jgi:hypothetical protein
MWNWSLIWAAGSAISHLLPSECTPCVTDPEIIRDLQALIQKMKVAYGTVGLNHRQMLFVPLFISGILNSRTGQSREAIDALAEILVDMCGMDEDEMLRGEKMVAKIPGEPMFIPRELSMVQSHRFYSFLVSHWLHTLSRF